MSSKSAIEYGYRQSDVAGGQPSFHISLPVSQHDCAHCVAVAEAGMQEISKVVAALEARAAREALLNAIGDAVRSMVGTRTIKMIAAGSLGDFLQVDRCFFVSYDATAATAVIEYDWRRDDRPSIAGTHALDDEVVDGYGLRDLRTHVVTGHSDEAAGRFWAGTPASPQAIVHVPLLESGIPVGALVVAMEDGPRDWSTDDICLVENVASIARSAIDTDHLRSRERSLRTSFRSALVPELPSTLHGLDLSVVYRPCDGDAGVGGDFYDVFEIGDGRVAMILGDVSGRGLVAAAQVATLRNMLRFAVYQRRPLAETVEEFNSVLVDNNLLSQYATAFISIYDPAAHTLSYVCCGQEPPLLRSRVSDQVTVLVPTGPVLGVQSSEPYREETVHIDRGDCLLIYSDGLSDVGLAHCQLYSVSRLIQILRHGRPPFSASTLVDAVMSGIVDYGVRGCNSNFEPEQPAHTNGKHPQVAEEIGRVRGVDDRLKHLTSDFSDDVCVLAAVFTQ